MAGGSHVAGRIIVLLFLILILVGGGILWFDYLNVIDAKYVIGPVFDVLRRVPLVGRVIPPGESRTPSPVEDGYLDIDAERFAVRIEALEYRSMEQDRRDQDLVNREGLLMQIAQELEERQRAQDEREKSFNALLSDAEIRDRNVERNAINLTNMPPQRAVGILEAMVDDQDVIDVLRKTDELAEASGSASIVPFWLSLMEPERAAEISRKMAARP